MTRVPRTGGGVSRPREPEVPAHFCPGCGKEQKAFLRYPWYFCVQCCDRADDARGRRLALTNQSIFGGLAWHYADDATRWDPTPLYVICFIDRRKVIVCEARFGGVAVQPLPSDLGRYPAPRDGIVDLTMLTAEQASARLVEVQASGDPPQ